VAGCRAAAAAGMCPPSMARSPPPLTSSGVTGYPVRGVHKPGAEIRHIRRKGCLQVGVPDGVAESEGQPNQRGARRLEPGMPGRRVDAGEPARPGPNRPRPC
jgi:hypothetical protein